MDDFQVLAVVFTLAIMLAGLAVAVSAIKNWPGRTPVDPE